MYEPVTAPEDWSRESHFSSFRMRHPNGNPEMHDMLQRHYNVPPAECTGTDARAPLGCEQRLLFEQYLWLTQLQQALLQSCADATGDK